MPRTVCLVPAVAGAIVFVSAIGYAIAGAAGLLECDYDDQVSTAIRALRISAISPAMSEAVS